MKARSSPDAQQPPTEAEDCHSLTPNDPQSTDHLLAVAGGLEEDWELADRLSDVARGAITDAETLALLYRLKEAGELSEYLASCLDEGDFYEPSEAQRETFSMLPGSVITSTLDDSCVRLYAFLDLVQGKDGRPPAAGLRKIGDALGWQARTVTTHAEHLIAAGLIEREQEGGERVVLRVVHNLSRGRRATGVALTPAEPRKKQASRVSKMLDAPVVRETHDSPSSPGSPPSAPDVRDTHLPPRVSRTDHPRETRDKSAFPSASEEVVCNQSELRVTEGTHEEEATGARDGVWPGHEVVERLLAAFPGAVVEDAA